MEGVLYVVSGHNERPNGPEARLRRYGVRVALVHHSCIEVRAAMYVEGRLI